LLSLYLYVTEKISLTAIEEHDNLKCTDNSRTSVVLDNRQWVLWVNYEMSLGNGSELNSWVLKEKNWA